MRNELLFFSLCFQTFSQQGLISTGASINLPGGQISYSVGQSAQSLNSSEVGTAAEGLQHAAETFVITFLEDLENTLLLNVYPNPAKDYVILEFFEHNAKHMFIELIDVNGKVILSSFPAEKTSKINLKEQKEDTYLINIYQSNKKLKTIKIIKAN